MNTSPVEPMPERWVFLLRLTSRPGVLSALTAVFADRGVSIETLNAHDGSAGGPLGSAVLTFAAPAAKKEYLARLLRRLATVHSVTEYRYDDALHTRKSVTARIHLNAQTLQSALPFTVHCDIMAEAEGQTLALLLGPPPLVDTVLASLTEQNVLEASDASVIVV